MSSAHSLASDIRSGDRTAHAFTGVHLVVAPGQTVGNGVLVIRGGVVERAGAEGKVKIPEDARVWDLKGKWIYPAFIDPFAPADRLAGKKPPAPIDEEEPPPKPSEPPGAQKPTVSAHPLASVKAERRVIDSLVLKSSAVEPYQRAGFAVVHAVPSAGVLRGKGAILALSDGALGGRIIRDEFAQVFALNPERRDLTISEGSIRRFKPSDYPMSKMGAVALIRQSLSEALWWRDAAAAWAAHPNSQPRPKFSAATAALVPAAQKKETVIFDTDDVLALLRAAKISQEFQLRSLYVTGNDQYRLRSEVAALRPELILRVDFLKPRKLEDEAEWLDVSLDELRKMDRSPSNPKWLREAGVSFSLTTAGLDHLNDFLPRVREAIARGLSKEDALAAVTTVPARQLGLGNVLGDLQPGKAANFVIASAEPFGQGGRAEEIWIDGARHELREEKKDAEGAPEKKPHDSDVFTEDVRPAPKPEAGAVVSPQAVVVRGATVWTQGPRGILEGVDLLAVDGKVRSIGRGLSVPAGAWVIDGRGKHVTPGIIDAHSHTGIDGSGNEITSNVTAEVRIKDVLNPFDVAIYRELAGGTTAANVLHGSANAIGGQNAILKWRWGQGPDGLLLAGAPEGIKFALGENPKRSNFQEEPPSRYPNTRMGVINLIRERFVAAKDYGRRLQEYRKLGSKEGRLAPIPDLQLQAISEVLAGKRLIHCHSYRKDEILEILRLAEEFGIRVATLQHVLEGYKVADEIARHGAGASTFSDWWAYKFEVYDAIPYNGALMKERGVLVTFNSDSGELARRLNLEAAKAVKYGGLKPTEALDFVTANAAKQLGISRHVGSLEEGKDADFVVWSGDPLATTTLALETWIDGKKYFDRAEDVARRGQLEQERASLVAKAKQMAEIEKQRARPPFAPQGGRPQ